MKENQELELSWNFVEKTDRNIFLTGKAGTGKTTFLHKIQQQSFKRKVTVAPTGVASINAKGVTIHSFFQMPFGPILPDSLQNENNSQFQKKFNRKKIDIIKTLDLLIIDEISMVRADLLDGIDQVLRRYRNKDKVFGGVQVLMIGDLQQLAPVVKQNDWQLLQEHYETPYFFSSKAFQQSNPIGIELKQIFRQNDEFFISILNEIRNNNISDSSLEELNKRYKPDFKPKEEDGYITLTTHNDKANNINNKELDKIKSNKRSFTASIEGDFPENSYPNHYKLELKIGAQVMFIKNDSSPDKRYYNGKIGKIVDIDDEIVTVRCPNDSFDIETTKERWDNVSYTINSKSKEIEENIKGSFSQIPLRLAWAITIHKSQGLTFDKAIIDAQSSFAHGQTYVALSRCKTIDGIVLKSKINKTSIISDGKVTSFTKNVEENPPSLNDLSESQKQYQLNLIQELFNYKQLVYPLNRLNKIAYTAGNSLRGNIIEQIKLIRQTGVDELIKVGDNFHRQLLKLSADKPNPEKNTEIQDRVKKGIEYFSKQSKDNIEEALSKLSFTTDNKQVDKDLKEQIAKIEEIINNKNFCFDGLSNGFETGLYLELRAKSLLQKPKKKSSRNYDYDNVANPKLFAALREWRHATAYIEDVEHFQIFTQKSLFEICEKLPLNKKELMVIYGFGKVRVDKYGDEILEIIQEYCENNDLHPIPIEIPKKKKKIDTKLASLSLFKEGKTIDEIASARDLTYNTIFGHLAHYIDTGEIKTEDIIDKSKLNKLTELIKQTSYESLSDLKYKLGDDYSFAEVRLVLKHLNKQ